MGIPPLWVQLSVLVEVQEIENVSPARTVLGLKDTCAVGAAAGRTVRVTGADVTVAEFRPGAWHVMLPVYVPECRGAAVMDPSGRGRVRNGVLLSNGGRLAPTNIFARLVPDVRLQFE